MAKKLRYSTEQVREIIESKGWKMLSSEYTGHKQQISLECSKGHLQKKTFESVKRDTKCLKCHYISGNGGKKTLEYPHVKEYIESRGYKLISTEYKRQGDLLEMICINGHSCHISFKKFKQDRRCRYCDPSRKKELKEVKRFIEEAGFELLSTEYISNQKLQIKCKKGHVLNKYWSDFYQRPTCGECTNPYKDMTRAEYANMYRQSDKGIYNRYKNDCNRRNRLSRGIQMTLGFEEFRDIINQNCSYCGKPNARGIDRVDSDESYTLENSVPCCEICNRMKLSLTKQEFLDHIKKIYHKHFQ